MVSSIKEVLDTLPVKGRVREYGLWKAWDELVGQQVSRRCQPERVKDGILFLKVTSSVWMQQLQFMKSMIIEKVNGQMGEGAVRDIRFRIGRMDQERRSVREPWRDVTLSRETLSMIEEQLSSIRDNELREAIKRVRVREEQVKEWRTQRRKGASSIKSPA
jgi:hypothetical protein